MIKTFEAYILTESRITMEYLLDKVMKFIINLKNEGVIDGDCIKIKNYYEIIEGIKVVITRPSSAQVEVFRFSIPVLSKKSKSFVFHITALYDEKKFIVYKIIKEYILEKLYAFIKLKTTSDHYTLRDNIDKENLKGIEFKTEDIKELYDANKFNL